MHVSKIHYSFAIIIIMALLAAVLIPSCAIQPLQYKRYEHLKIGKVKLNPELSMDLVFFNPNGAGCLIKNMDLNVVVNSDTLADINLDQVVKLRGYSEFTVPVLCAINTAPLIRTSIKGLLTGNDIKVNYVGTVTIQKFIFRKKYAINFSETMNRKQLLNF